MRGDVSNPVAYLIFWYHHKINLNEGDGFFQPLYSILRVKYPVTPVHSEEELTAVPVSEIYLEIMKKTPILLRKYVGF